MMQDDETVRLLHSMVRIPSVSFDEANIARFLVGEMSNWGFDAWVDDAGNAIGMAGEGPRTIALVGHIDTVAGDLPVRLEEGILHGRGAVDAKGPMATFVSAATRCLAQSSPVRLLVVGCVEEEAPTSAGARNLLANSPLEGPPDFLVIGEPSGWEGMTLGYKGYMRSKIRLEIEAAHTAHDVKTVAAQACDVWQQVSHGCERFNEGKARVFDRLLPALIRLETRGDGVHDHATLDVSLRLPPDMSIEEAEAWLVEHTPGCDVTTLGALPAWAGPRTTLLHRSLARAIRAQNGHPIYKLKTGTADLNILAPAWGCPALAYGPGDASLDHTPNEHIRIDDYLRSVAILTETLVACAELPSSAVRAS